jgi:hypothetical protein
VLTVVEGAWTKAALDSGVLICSMDINTGVLNKTWGEIYDAMESCGAIIYASDGNNEFRSSVICAIHMGNQYGVVFYDIGGQVVFATDSEDGYPARESKEEL